MDLAGNDDEPAPLPGFSRVAPVLPATYADGLYQVDLDEASFEQYRGGVVIEVRYFDATGDLVDAGSEALHMTVPAMDNATFKVSSCAAREEAAYATHTTRIRIASDARDSL